jgi:hypothetical protein
MVNVFSFCLYGRYNERYYPGLLENIFLAGKYFPTWKVYVYYAPDVEESTIKHLEACTSVVLRPTGELGAKNMIHRFFAIDEPEVELMMVRDADSRIHWKDRWAIRDFLEKPNFVAHTIRDNIQHTAKMMGGLWGIRKSSGLFIKELYASYIEDVSQGFRLAHDQNFLGDIIYPLVLPKLLVHYSNGRYLKGEYAIEFPFDWINDIYCGRIEGEFIDRPEPRITSLNLPNISIRVKDFSTPVEVTTSVQTLEPSYKITPTSNILNFLYKK